MAYEIYRNNKLDEFNITILEKDCMVGGISKTVNNDGYLFDLGGHRFFTKIKDVEEIWYEILGDDFLTRPRLSRIYYNKKFFKYPVELKDAIAKLGIKEDILIILWRLNQ